MKMNIIWFPKNYQIQIRILFDFMRRTPLKVERDRQIFRIAKRAVAHIDSESEKNEFFDFEELSLDTGFRTKDCVAVKLTASQWDDCNIV